MDKFGTVMSRNRIGIAGLVLVLLLATWKNSFAGGYALPQQTSRAVGLSNASIAGVKDPSAVYYNPAALSEVDGNRLVGTINYINVQSSVENSGRKSHNLSENNVVPTLFGNFHIPNSDVTLGLGFYSPFGLSVSYDRDSFTRYAVVDADLAPYYINWAVSWRPNDMISVGGGVSYVGSSAKLSRAIYLDGVLGAGAGDARAKITGGPDTATFNLGILLSHPKLPLKFGLTYRNRALLNFDGAGVEFIDSPGAGGAQFNTQVARGHILLPTVVSAGLFWQVNPRWTLELVYDWTKWNELEQFKLIFENSLPAAGGAVPIPSLTISADWKNTSTLRLGTHFKLNQNWDFLAGIALDESPVPSSTLGPLVPSADILTLNGGVEYTWKKLTLGLSYMAVFYQDREVQNDILEAEAPGVLAQPFTPGPDKYETFNNFVSMSVGYRF